MTRPNSRNTIPLVRAQSSWPRTIAVGLDRDTGRAGEGGSMFEWAGLPPPYGPTHFKVMAPNGRLITNIAKT